SGKVYKERIRPSWLPGGDRFWYRNDLSGGRREFVLVDAPKGRRAPAFDHARLAEALSRRLGREVRADGLPIDALEFDRGSVRFTVGERGFRWDDARRELRELGPAEIPLPSLPNLGRPEPSGPAGEETEILFVNRLRQTLRLYWIDPEGARQAYGELAPGSSRRQHTYENHVWLVADAEGRPVAAFRATAKPATAVVDGRAAERPQRPRRPQRPDGSSPDGKWVAFFRDHNLWIREASTGKETRLSSDGAPGHAYRGEIAWSPDSTRIAVFKVEDGDRRKITLVESSPRDQLQPKVRTIDYPKPGDELDQPRPHLFEVPSGREIPIPTDLFPNAYETWGLRWFPDSSRFTFVYNERGHQVLRVIAVDASTGQTRAMVEERSPTFIHYSGKFFLEFLDDRRELVWMSERDGWNHLYLIDQETGRVKRRITKGEWVVQGVDRLDPAKRQIWFRAGGIDPAQDPYHTHFCRVDIDSGRIVDLTPGDGTHTIEYSPDGRFYIDRYSRVDLPPVHELRRTEDGALLCKLEEADASELLATGWRPPERFVAKGRDGKTDIYGIIVRPITFDPARRYPVIESIYAGPHGFHVPKAWGLFAGQLELAELGFVIVQIDGMGTSGRSKAFHDVCWRNLKDAGFPDRILWMKAAAETRPWMDLTRVGIFGGSAGGQNALGALLFHGDFYKAAVADCGCHDNRMDKIWWNEQWMGYPIGPWYEESSNVVHAHRLQGKLLLILGELDTNVDPASTLQVVDALNRAGKDYEFLFVPGGGHCPGGSPYGLRRQRDFFVRALHGVEPRSR
ncbi:MAG: DPP IV N-terminal domain-containing protein, partial [Fimbriimonadales bacterium]|nr:DPP IV N-terminal domain-containing protein [Fimbriimonadales bacterium]